MEKNPHHSMRGQFDAICDAFDEEWATGKRPDLDSYLARIEEEQRTPLAVLLIEIDVEYRMGTGKKPKLEDYCSVVGNDDRDAIRRVIDRAEAELKSADQSYGSGKQDSDDARDSQSLSGDETITPEKVNDAANNLSLPSQRSFGDYEVIDEIARGGMGVVYKARQKSLNRTVALKMILSGQLAGEEEISRFRSEAEAAAKLDHPGIVPIYEIGEHDGHQFFSMGFVEGQSLADKISDGPLPAKEAAELVRKIAVAIAYAHEHGVIHRDLKPANVLIDSNGEPRVTDFGLAKKIEDDSGLTATGQILGTPSFMPPEQASGDTANIDERADIYALGAILYNLITGRPPFQSANPMDTLVQVLQQEPVSPRKLTVGIPKDLETICLKCLQKEKPHRYPTSAELVDDLERFLNGDVIRARPVGIPTRAARWTWKRRRIVGVVASFVALAAVLTIVATNVNHANQKRLVLEQADAFFTALEANDQPQLRDLMTEKFKQSKWGETWLETSDEIAEIHRSPEFAAAAASTAEFHRTRELNSATVSGKTAVVRYSLKEEGQTYSLSLHLLLKDGAWRVDQYGEFEEMLGRLEQYGESNQQATQQMFEKLFGPAPKNSHAEQYKDKSTNPSGVIPQFENAITEPPEWAGYDLPFDIEKYLGNSMAENAAPLYLDALFEFDPELVWCFPDLRDGKGGVKPGLRWGKANVRSYWFGAVYERFTNRGELVSPEELGELEELLDQYADGISKIAKAQQRKKCLFQTPIDPQSLTPHLSAARTAARVMSLEGAVSLYKGDSKTALDRVRTTLRLARDLRSRGDKYGQLTAVAIEGICFNSMVKPLLAFKGLTVEDCDKLIQILVQHANDNDVDPSVEAARYEHLVLRRLLYELENKLYVPAERGADLGVEQQSIAGMLVIELVDLSQCGINSGLLNQLVTERAATDPQIAEALEQLPDNPLFQSRRDKVLLKMFLAKELLEMKEADYQNAINMLNRRYRQIVEASNRQYPQRVDELNKLGSHWTSDDSWKNAKILRFFAPGNQGYESTFQRNTLQKNAFRCLAALAKWNLENEDKVDDITTLMAVPGDGQVPLDPYCGESLKLGMVDGRQVIYSVGPDGDDDQAQKSLELRGYSRDSPDGDFVFDLNWRKK